MSTISERWYPGRTFPRDSLTELNTLSTALDDLDRSLIASIRANPRASLTTIAKIVKVARGTVYSRLDRLERDGVITGYGPELDARAAGFGVLAFCTVEIEQGSHEKTTRAVAEFPEVLEIHTVTGDGDLLLRIVATSNDHLHEVLQAISSIDTVDRTQTQLALTTTVNRPTPRRRTRLTTANLHELGSDPTKCRSI